MFSCFLAVSASLLITQHEERSFLAWMRATNQIFTGDDYSLRLGVWLANSRIVAAHNAGESSFTLAMNKFAALTPAEYRSLLGFRTPATIEESDDRNVKPSDRDSLDWREEGCVTDIKDQGSCGSCWAFSAACSIEGVWAAKHKELISMSESMLVDCDSYDSGCSGGNMYKAYDYVLDHQEGKWMTESDYPYKASARTCAYDDSKALFRFKSYVNITKGKEDILQSRVEEYGPVAVAIDASHMSFQLYFGGIYDEPQCKSREMNHGVGCVGFGVEGEKQFWIVKNSWGTWWGESGYIRMIRYYNQCGIATMSSCTRTHWSQESTTVKSVFMR